MVQVHDAGLEPALVKQFEPHQHPVGQRPGPAADQHRVQVQMQLVDEPVAAQRLAGERGAADQQVAVGAALAAPTAAGSNDRSSVVRAVETSSSVRE